MKQMTMVSSDLDNKPLPKIKKRMWFSIKSIDAFVENIKHIDLAKKILLQEEMDFGGFKQLFEDFYSEIRKKLVDRVKDPAD